MSLFINLTGDARKDKAIIANIKRTMSESNYSELYADAKRMGEVFFSALALHGERLDKREWNKLEETEQLRYGALAQKTYLLMDDAAHANCDHGKDDESVTFRIPGELVAVAKAIFPAVLAHFAGGSLVTGAPQKPEMVNIPLTPWDFNFDAARREEAAKAGVPFTDMVDEEVKKVLDQKEVLK